MSGDIRTPGPQFRPHPDPVPLASTAGLSRDELDLVAAYRRLRKSNKVGIVVVQWNGLVTHVLETLPAATIGV